MVQLNTTYDSSIHQKVFVLKGDEGYARTTDTIATLITNFGNYTTYISKCHVGLEIQVLRELGDSFLHIYCDDEELYSIPWSDSGMAQIINEDWNEKGVYWENGKLIIGKYVPNSINTGLFLLYDVEHTIKVRYDGNKNCLGSSAKPIVFTVPKPDYFATTLTFNKENPRYAPDTTIDDITVTLTSDHQMTSVKTVNIYDVTSSTPVLLDTVDLEQDVATSITLEGLEDGLHKIRASWVGDSESYATDSEIELSVGYKITNLEYPSYLFTGDVGRVSCFILDYFDNPWRNKEFKLYEEINSMWNYMGKTESTDIKGYIKFIRVPISSHPYALFNEDSIMSSEIMTTEIIDVSNIQVAFDNLILEREQSTNGQYYPNYNKLTATVIGSDNQPIKMAGIPLTVVLNHPYTGSQTYDGVTNINGQYIESFGSYYAGVMTAEVSVNDTEVSNSTSFIIPEYWWSNNKQVGTPIYSANATVFRASNGYVLSCNDGSSATLKFDFNPNTGDSSQHRYSINGIYAIEFDCTGIGGSGYIAFDGQSINSVQIENKHIRVVHNTSANTIQVYANGNHVKSFAYTGLAFIMGVTDSVKLKFDNLVIVRES